MTPAEKTSTSPDAPEQMIEAIHQLMHLYRAKQYSMLKDQSFELNHMEYKVLHFFSRHPQSTQKDLVKHSGRDKSQLTRLITSLKDKGLLETVADVVDRRVIRIGLTPAGESIHTQVHTLGKQLSQQAVAGITAAESSALLQVLSKIRANLSID